MRSDQMIRSSRTSHSHVAVRVSSSAAARLAWLTSSEASASSRSVTSMVAPITRVVRPSASVSMSVHDWRKCAEPSGWITRKTSPCPDT